jgi:hypothetical protein
MKRELHNKLLVIINARREFLDKLQMGIVTVGVAASYYELRRMRMEELPEAVRRRV